MSDELEQDMEIYLLYIDRTPGLKVSENFWTIISCDVIPKSVPLLKGYFDPIIPWPVQYLSVSLKLFSRRF